jgi:hypothetical protein
MPPRGCRDARGSGLDFRYVAPRLFLEGDAFHAARRCLASNKDFTDSSVATGVFRNAYQVNSRNGTTTRASFARRPLNSNESRLRFSRCAKERSNFRPTSRPIGTLSHSCSGKRRGPGLKIFSPIAGKVFAEQVRNTLRCHNPARFSWRLPQTDAGTRRRERRWRHL